MQGTAELAVLALLYLGCLGLGSPGRPLWSTSKMTLFCHLFDKAPPEIFGLLTRFTDAV